MDKLNDYITELVKKHSLAIEEFTQEQFAEVIRQMVLAGDFIRFVHNTNNNNFDIRQAIQYIPFYDKQRLQNKVDDLEEKVKKLTETLETIAYDKMKCFTINMNNSIGSSW